jgi:hypothetical protein
MIGMPNITLYNWVRRGWVKARQHEQPPRRWIVWADEAEIERLRQRHQQPAGYATRQYWLEKMSSISATDASTSSAMP